MTNTANIACPFGQNSLSKHIPCRIPYLFLLNLQIVWVRLDMGCTLQMATLIDGENNDKHSYFGRFPLIVRQTEIYIYISYILYYIILYYFILYYIILYYSILYYSIVYYIILYYIILYCIILYYSILYYIILYYIILHYITLYYIILYYIISYIVIHENSHLVPTKSREIPCLMLKST
jgi:hypothetical protein